MEYSRLFNTHKTNPIESFTRFHIFGKLIKNTEDLVLEIENAKLKVDLKVDLTVIFKKL